jgi:cytochrome c-type biogenesis protein CcmH/NrfG
MKIMTAALPVIFCFLFAISAFAQDLNLGKKLLVERKLEEASAEFAKFRKETPGYADSRYYLGIICTRKNEFEKAETYLRQAIALNDNNADYHVAMGSLLGQEAMDANLIKQGLLAPKIKNEFETAARLDPKNIEARWMLINYYIRAPKIMGGDVEKGKAVADEIMKLNPAEGNSAWGTIWRSEKRNDLAEKNYQTAIILAIDSIKYYYALARFYEAIPNTGKALETYHKTAEKFPGNRQAYLQIGRVTANSGSRMDEGEKSLNKFIGLTENKKDRSLANAYYYLGLIEKKRGNLANAKKYIETALKLNPEHNPSIKLQKEL